MIVDLNEKGSIIDSAAMIAEKLRDDFGMLVKNHEVLKVLKQDLGMSYKKIKPASIHANSPKNLVLR